MLDILIKGGTVIDGTGRPCHQADVAITGNMIEAVGDLENAQATSVIDARNLIVAPGFIDMHTHSDTSLLDDPHGESKAYQGVTTEVMGNCSYSPFPIGPDGPKDTINKEPHSKAEWDWTDLDGWANRLEDNGISLNVAPQVGHGALRTAVGATSDRPATPDELEAMKRLAIESVEQGAFSMSTGLNLAPSGYAPTDEIVALCRAIAPYGAFYVTHARVGNGRHLSMIEEAVEIGNRSEIAVQFSHLAITDRRVYGHGPQMLNLFEQARTNGLDITYDVYPYTAAGAGLDQTIPLWAQTGGIDGLIDRLQDTKTRVRIRNEVAAGLGGLTPQWETWVVSYLPQGSDPGEVGLSVKEIALRRGIEAAEAVLQLTEESRGTVSGVIHNRIESDVRLFLSHPLAMIGSDGTAVSPDGVYAGEPLHPRFYGTHPRILGRYVREQSLMSLETAVHKMTGMPAERLNLKDRGLVSEGLTADLAIFDPCQVTDHATFEDPHQLSEGVLHVLVNGRPIISNGKHTRALPGRVIRHQS